MCSNWHIRLEYQASLVASNDKKKWPLTLLETAAQHFFPLISPPPSKLMDQLLKMDILDYVSCLTNTGLRLHEHLQH